ncbi:MAG: CCA tRNA nucleotidyltransferase [bacterium]|nr:CCA tRNA nucleotidyltransferase [bacterium]
MESIKTIKPGIKIPTDIKDTIHKIAKKFNENGYECYLVGGSVRDLVLGQDIYDYDFATNATPNEVMKLFKKVIPTGIKHGTVTVLIESIPFEVTTYRADGKYIDGRRPESVSFSNTLEEDVARRDFTINGLAYDIINEKIVDHVGGLKDLENKIIRTIGNPLDRFSEDGLRSYRACRFASKLEFEIEEKTFAEISKTLHIAGQVSVERVRDEIMKMMDTVRPSIGLEYMRKSGLLDLSLPELAACYEVDQNRFHVHDVYYHSVYSCDAGPKDDPLIRLAALLHDIGKVASRRVGKDGDHTFYNHEVIGAKQVRRLMKRLKFSNDEIARVNNLVINHMFHYTDDWTDGAVRRFMRKVGVENMESLFQLRQADRVGNGSREGIPAPIKKLVRRVEKVIEEENAITVKDLNIDGNILMDSFKLQPGRIIGKILNELLEMVLDEPEINTSEILLAKAKEILDNSNTAPSGG